MVNFAGVKRGMRALLCRGLVLLTGLLLVGASAALAQDENPPESRPPEPVMPPDVFKDGTLDLSGRIYILDSRNKPVFVPTTFEQYLDRAADAARRADGGDAPRYSFDEFLVQARVVGKVADLDARVKVTLNDLPRKITEISLRLQSCMLTQKPTFESNGKSQIQVGRNGKPGYTWWLQADATTTHTATFVGQSVVQSDGDRQSLLVALPATMCTVQVSLPANIQDIIVRGQGGELTSDEPFEGGRRVTIKSQGGDLNVSWRTGGDSKPAAGAVEAMSKTRLSIDDPHQPWLAETLINLRSYGDSPIDSLVVELPEGSQLLPADKQSVDPYTVVVDETNPRKLTVKAAARVNRISLESVQLRYRWQAPAKPEDKGGNNIAVPNVLIRGVDRHEGTLTILVPASLGLEWKSPPGVALIGQSSVGEIRESVQYVFEFVRQPLGLNVSFRREVNLAEVSPTYLFEVNRDGIKLTGWLQCAFDRATEPELGIDLGDWELESAEIIADVSNPLAKGELLNQQMIEEDSQRILKLRSQLDPEPAGARREQQVWRITAFRRHAATAVDRLALAVPSILLLAPDRTRVPLEHASGLLLLVASDNVMLEYDGQSSRSLLTDAIAEPWQTLLAHVSQDRVLSYRFQAGGQDKPVWSGRLEILPRRIAAEQSVQLVLDPQLANVHQRFQLQIANEPLSQLQLATNGAQNVSVLVDGIPWVLESPPSENAQATNIASDKNPDVQVKKENNSLIAKGGRKLLGKVLVEVHSQQTLPNVPATQVAQGDSRWAADAVATNIPLVSLAVDDVLVRSPITVVPTIDRSLQVSVGSREALTASSEETSEEAGSKATWTVLKEDGLEIPASQFLIPLKLVQVEGADPLPVRVSGAWMQTVVSGSTRADRFCTRFKTAQDSIQLRLPANDLLAQVAIDGVEQVFIAPRDGEVEISLREASRSEEHTLEVWTRSTATAGWVNKIDVLPIEIEGCARFDHFYWQLVTNPNMHLALMPEHLTPEWTWVWDRLWWRRNSPMDQADLEQWLSASSQRPLAQAANKYVVSSYGAVAGFQVWTVSRLLLWLPIGLIAIGGALLVSLFRTFRHPAALLLLVACVLSMATIWPDLAILLGQTSIAALVVVLLYALTQAAMESRVRRRSVFTSRPTSGAYDASDNQSLVRPLAIESDVMPTTHTQSPIVTDGGGS